jgi:hypothetical protein
LNGSHLGENVPQTTQLLGQNFALHNSSEPRAPWLLVSYGKMRIYLSQEKQSLYFTFQKWPVVISRQAVHYSFFEQNTQKMFYLYFQMFSSIIIMNFFRIQLYRQHAQE